MVCAILIIDIRFSDCRTLKEKRSALKPLLHRLHREFNVSAAEVDKNDVWNESIIGCALVSNDKCFAQASLAKIPDFITNHFSASDILQFSIQIM